MIAGEGRVTSCRVPGDEYAVDTIVTGIDGGNIVGYYRYAGGHYQGFIATIPEPAPLSLLTLGTLILLRRRR